jgi:hypothetical protein
MSDLSEVAAVKRLETTSGAMKGYTDEADRID